MFIPISLCSLNGSRRRELTNKHFGLFADLQNLLQVNKCINMKWWKREQELKWALGVDLHMWTPSHLAYYIFNFLFCSSRVTILFFNFLFSFSTFWSRRHAKQQVLGRVWVTIECELVLKCCLPQFEPHCPPLNWSSIFAIGLNLLIYYGHWYF